MVHRAARPVGDPHWPVRVTLANMTRGADGRWSTVAGRWSTVAADEWDLMRPAPAVQRNQRAIPGRARAPVDPRVGRDRPGPRGSSSGGKRDGGWVTRAAPVM